MELEYAILADNAERLMDGRICIFGGDFDALQTVKLPVVVRAVLTAKMVLEAGEEQAGHTFGVDLTRPTGEKSQFLKASELLIAKPPGLPAQLPGGAGIMVNLNLKITEPGLHNFHLIVDGKERRTMPFWVELADPHLE